MWTLSVGERAEIVPIPRLHYHIHPKKPQPAGYGWRFRFTGPESRVWTPANAESGIIA